MTLFASRHLLEPIVVIRQVAGYRDPALGQIPAALRTLVELELKVLGYEDRVAPTGKNGGPVKTQHIFQPDKELWDKMLRKRAEYERLRDGDTDEDTASDSL